jgi:hypothetical protein
MENLKRGCRVMSKRRRYIVVLVAIMSLIVGIATLADAEYKAVNKGDALDLSVLLSQQHPCWWPGHAEYVRYDYRVIGPGAFRTHVTIIDEHTGTHFDAAPLLYRHQPVDCPMLQRMASSQVKRFRFGSLSVRHV